MLIALTNFGCTNFRQAIGSEKMKLDEFSIVEKNKLEMPPKFDLKSEMDVTLKTGSKAKDEISLLFGVERRLGLDEIDSDLAQFFQFNSIVPNIREIIDQETYELQSRDWKANIAIMERILPIFEEHLPGPKIRPSPQLKTRGIRQVGEFLENS